jgi:hypothetical protein
VAGQDEKQAQIQQLQLADFKALFTGNSTNYGEHAYHFSEDGKKEDGKNKTVKSKLLTMDQYRAHLEGKAGLGVIPITENSECKFRAIDVDVYENMPDFVGALERGRFPLIPFRSKSGGLHLYLFLKEMTPAKQVTDVLRQMVTLMGLDTLVKKRLNKIIEIFPKQETVREGQLGNWINLPYFNAKATRQWAVREGKPLSLDAALTYAKEKQRTVAEIRRSLEDFPGNDGPPCLQTIKLLHETQENSGRNNYLFSLAVYLKKKDENFWEQRLFEANEGMAVPLSKQELESTIISTLRKKDYSYKCFDTPCVDFCRRPLCKTREYGVGKEGGYFSELEFGKIFQIMTGQPYYEWEVKAQGAKDFKLLRFQTEDEIIKQDAFLRLCMRELHILPIKMKQVEWFKLINQALSEIEQKTVAPEDDTSPFALFKNLFLDFLLRRAMANTRDQVLTKRVFFDKSTARYYFRSADLSDYMFVSKGFRYFAPGELHGLLRDIKAQPTKLRTESGKQIRVYEICQADLNTIGEVKAEPFVAKFEKDEEAF